MVVITVMMKVIAMMEVMEVMMMGPLVGVHAEFLNLNC